MATDKDINCQLVEIVEKHGFLQCFNYASKKCRKLADALDHESDNLLKDIAEAQAGLLLVQMSLTPKIPIECFVNRLQQIIDDLTECSDD